MGWVLLGLLVVAGAVHGPLHDAGTDCGPLSLCSGAVVLAMAAVVLLAILLLERQSHLRPLVLSTHESQVRRLRHGRAPPQS